MHSMKSEARSMNSAKLKRMGIDGKTEGKMYGAEAMPPMMDTTKPTGGKPGKKRFATGGAVLGGDDDEMGGASAPRRLDKAKRGKGGSTVNIVIAPQGAAGAAPPPPMPGPQPGMVAPPSPPPPPPAGGVPPAALAALMGGGGPKPPGLKTGGRAPFKSGGAVKRATGGVASLSERIGQSMGGSGGGVSGAAPTGSAASNDAVSKLATAAAAADKPEQRDNPAGADAASAPMKRGGKACRATGGKVYDAGAGTGEGRLEKKAAYGKNARQGEGR